MAMRGHLQCASGRDHVPAFVVVVAVELCDDSTTGDSRCIETRFNESHSIMNAPMGTDLTP
jgi:hypothetical protein